MSTRLFNNHEADDRIMLKKDKLEVGHWTETLEHINEELEFLSAMEDRFLKDRELYVQLQTIRRENTLKSSALYRYENAMRNAWECDDMACDAYYLNNHEKHRELYTAHIAKYRKIKANVFSKLLLRPKTQYENAH